MFELLGHKSFVRFWWARTASTMATQMLMLAIGWYMYDLTGSAWDLGLVGLFQFAPALVMTLLAGQVVDRVHRARLVALCQAVQTCVALGLAWAAAEGEATRTLLLTLSLILGALRPFQMSAQQALAPLLVPPILLARATAFSSSATQAAVIAGPAVGGLLFALHTNAVYLSCALLFGIAAMLSFAIRYEHEPAAREPVSMDSLLAGARFVWRHPQLLGAVSLDLFAVLLGGATALLPMFARDILHIGPQGLGLLRSAPAVGAVCVGVYLARHPLQRRVGHKLLLSVSLFGICMVVFGLSRSVWLSAAALVISGGADMVSVVVRQTLVQLETPNHMRGRVAAINTLFIGASNQLGEFESGAAAALMGPVAAVVLGGVGTIGISLLWRRLFEPLAQREQLLPSQKCNV